MEFLPGLVYPRSVVGVNDKNQALSAREVMPPQRPNLVLSTHIPHIELDILVRDRLDVEADCRDRRDILVELELVEDCYNTMQLVI